MIYEFDSTKLIRCSRVQAPAYPFPIIYHKNDILDAIAGRDEFRFRDCGDHETLNYVVNLEDTFPHINPKQWSPTDDLSILRRECRGIAFDKRTGLIIRRPPHKFFNLNERPETEQKIINWNSPFIIMDKEDGSCISAYKDSTGRIIWGTPAGPTEFTPYVEKFVEENPQYAAAASYLIDLGWTPTFEYCGQVNRVVVKHEKPRLPLTCVRHVNNGSYLPYDQMVALRDFGIEVTGAVTKDDVGQRYDPETKKVLKPVDILIEKSKVVEGTEGWIVRFDSGHMVKVKTDWYREIHGCVTEIRYEKDVLSLIMNKRLDDISEFLTDTMREKMTAYAEEVYIGFVDSAMDVSMIIHENKNLTKKEFVAKYKGHELFSFLCNAFDRKDSFEDNFECVGYAFDDMWKYVQDRTFSQTWVDRLRYIYGHKRFEF